MKSSSQLTSEPLSLLLMGPPGGSKTTLLLQFPGLWIGDGDHNLGGPARWLKSKGLLRDFKYDNLDVDDDNSPIAPSMKWDNLKKRVEVAAKDPTVQTIGIDSLTWCDQAIYDHVCRVQQIKEVKGYLWGHFKREANAFVNGVKAYGKTLVITCHEKAEFTQSGAISKYVPAFSGLESRFLGWMFSDVWRVTLEDLGGKHGYKSVVKTLPTATADLKNSLMFGKEIEASYNTIEKALTPMSQTVPAQSTGTTKTKP